MALGHAVVESASAYLAVEAAYNSASDRLMRLARILVGDADSADVLAAAVLRTLEACQRTQIDDVAAYLTTSVYNEARRLLRYRFRAGEVLQRIEGSARPTAPPEAADVAILHRLPMRQRAALFLTYWNDMTPTQVAAALGISEGAVRRHLARARARLRKELNNDER